MRIKWVEIKNFRSIKNSKRFYLNSRFNILAGKNESGKSNVLKALKSFSDNNFIEEDKCHYSEGDPSVTVCFVIDSKEELKDIFTSQYKYSNNISEFIVERSSGNGSRFSGDIADVILNAGVKFYESKEESFKSIIKDVNLLLRDLSEKYDVKTFLPKANFSFLDIVEYRRFFDFLRSSIWDEDGNEYDYGDEAIISALKGFYRDFSSLMIDGDRFSAFLSNLVPNIILFNSFEDHLPEFITKGDIERPVIKNFFSLTSCNPESLFNASGKERSKLINNISTSVTGDFQNYYNQDKIKIKMNADGERVYFEIYDDNDEINPFFISQRSQGFQWFLSFYITLNAEKKQNSIILIDEPGLFLHAKAQENVLEMLINLSDKHQIVITTHSPYFIDPDRLDRVSLVIKDEVTYTYVENKVHKGSDYTTLTPIITAIGLDITRNIGFSKDFNILTEGISDYYYLQAMKEYLRKEYLLMDFNIIPAQGANSVSNLASLLMGWNLKFIALFDNDSEGKRNYNKIKKNLYLEDDYLCFVSGIENTAIEDLFSPEDFQKYILEESNIKKSNSDNVKNKEKPLLAKLFNEKVMNSQDELVFSSVTISNFIDLFKRLSLIIEDVQIVVDSKEEVL
ncbi:ATP-binding protein [Bacillus thuringiensis]|uniref:ATP-binding protein n=1 Tax=Bacillus cereus group TaxID=86661 RepID=UPI000BF76D8B|nr:ATP-binding protein [Bacillus thuringiensis]PES31054.1 hypothetical protein CN493_28145 [Bacillus thuringiensis]